jgi:septal ring factor EnvC (AmiA/AmiB activator)
MTTLNTKNKKKNEIPIEEKIIEWAKDLGYPYQNDLYIADNSSQISEVDLKNLCKHNLLPLFQFLVTHVKKESDIKKVQTLLAKSVNHSLTINRKTTSLYRTQTLYRKEKEERKKLIAQIKDLKQSIKTLKLKIDVQTKKCEKLSALIVQNGKEIEDNKNNNELLKKRIYIQECYQNQCIQYSEY